MSDRLMKLNSFVDSMRERQAVYVSEDEAYQELEAGGMPFVFRHEFALQEGSASVTFITDIALKLVSSYYGSDFDQSMSVREYLEMVGMIPPQVTEPNANT